MSEQKWIAMVDRLQAWKETIILPRWIIDDVKDLVRENARLREMVEKQRGLTVQVSDGDVWLVVPNAMLSLEAAIRMSGPVVKNAFRAWRDAILAALDQPEEQS